MAIQKHEPRRSASVALAVALVVLLAVLSRRLSDVLFYEGYLALHWRRAHEGAIRLEQDGA